MQEFAILGQDRERDDFVQEETEKTLSLHAWQRKALEEFLTKKHLIVEAATGSGKSVFATECIKKVRGIVPNIKVLIVSPTNVIMERTWYTQLYENGISLRDIGVFYGNIKEEMDITLTNIQSIEKLDYKKYDFIVADELHTMGTDRLLNILKHDFKYKLGLSATLKRIDQKHYDLLECFGYNTFKYTIKQALADDVICFFDFHAIGLILDDKNRLEYDEITDKINALYSKFGGYNRIMTFCEIAVRTQLLGMMTERKQLVNNYPKKFEALKNIIRDNKDSKILVFNQFNEITNKCYWELLDEGVNAEIIHSGVDDSKREKILTDFKRDRFNVLLTSRVLDQGYNLPAINIAIILSNDSGGERQLLQRLGRSLRKKKDNSNSKLYVVYIKDTIEENARNMEMLEELSSNFKEYIFQPDEEIKIG